jgi:hypothetical protein
MSTQYAVFVEGLAMLDDLAEIPADIERKAVQAINKTARRARTAAKRAMKEQIAFPPSYVNDSRFMVSPARSGRLEAKVSARDRPTSLARFVTNMSGSAKESNRKFRRLGARIRVKPGATRVGRHVFAIPLRNGNIGLAVRTNGGPPSRAHKPKRLSDNVYLLYGPSVDQVFKSVRDDIDQDAGDYLEREFLRLMDLGDRVK